MDLKGSLTDTHLKIYPSENFITFLQTISSSDNVPENILKFCKSSKDALEVKRKDNAKNEGSSSVKFTDKDIKNLNKIKDEVKKIKGDEPEPEKVNESDDASILSKKVSESPKEVTKGDQSKADETTTDTNRDQTKSGESTTDTSKDQTKSGESTTDTTKDQTKSGESTTDTTKDQTKSGESTTDTTKDQTKCGESTTDTTKDQTKSGDSTTDVSSLNSFEEILPEREGPFLYTSDITWLYTYLEKKRKKEKDIPYLHELFDGTEIDTPRNSVLKRNPVLEARCVKLRSQQEAREYRKMTRGVDNVRIRFPDDSISYQLKQINRQLIAIGQFIISIFAGFLFGFKGVEWLIGPMDFGFKLLLGVMCALIIALAEIYFLAKKLNEELSVPETVQLGGPPQFVDKKYGFEPRVKEPSVTNKEHQD